MTEVIKVEDCGSNIGDYDVPIHNAIIVLQNVTNGDVIKAIFPDCKDWKAKIEENDGEVYEVHFVQLPNSITINKYDESWWNSPYKAESEE